jgi:hypothetical protein
MGHCSGGVGAWEIQQSTLNAAITASQNIPFSLIAWVEQGQDPETILGTMHVNDTKSLGVSVRGIIASIRTELPISEAIQTYRLAGSADNILNHLR